MLESFYEQRPSRSSFVDYYWHMSERKDGRYPLYATVKWGFVFSKHDGMYSARIIGPRTVPTEVEFKKGEYFWGIVINADVNVTGYSKKHLLNQIIDLEVSKANEITLNGEKVCLPGYAKLDEFTAMAIRQNILFATPIIADSHRDKQRKVKRHTGLTQKQIEQVDRVERAMSIINGPASLSEVAAQVGFSDQAHMTRDFQRLVGYSPAEIRTFFLS